MAPETLEIKLARLADFKAAFETLMREAVSGVHSDELKDAGVVLTSGTPADVVRLRALTSQAVSADDFVQLAVDYSPLFVPIGRQLWDWAWPKLRNKFDGVKSADQNRR